MWIHLLPLGLIDGAGSSGPVAPPGGATPGFIGRIPGQFKVEDAEEKRRRRESYEKKTVEPPVDLTAEYRRKSTRLARSLQSTRNEIQALREAIAKLEAIQTAKAQAAMLRKQQAMQLAAIREALILEQIEVIDVAYVAAAVLTLQ